MKSLLLIFLLATLSFATAEFDKNRADGRVYATLVMDASLEYNSDALAKLNRDKYGDYNFAGMWLTYRYDQETNLINYIALKQVSEHEFQRMNDNLLPNGTNKVERRVDVFLFIETLKAKYSLINHSESDFITYILDSSAQKITYEFDNKGDQILLTYYRSDYNKYGQYELEITYRSKTLIAKERKAKTDALKKQLDKERKIKSEINLL